MTGSACPIGASAKADAFIIIHNQIILLNPLSRENLQFSRTLFAGKAKN